MCVLGHWFVTVVRGKWYMWDVNDFETNASAGFGYKKKKKDGCAPSSILGVKDKLACANGDRNTKKTGQGQAPALSGLSASLSSFVHDNLPSSINELAQLQILLILLLQSFLEVSCTLLTNVRFVTGLPTHTCDGLPFFSETLANVSIRVCSNVQIQQISVTLKPRTFKNLFFSSTVRF